MMLIRFCSPRVWFARPAAWLAAVCCCGLFITAAGPARADQVTLDVGLSNPTMLAGEKALNHMRISLTGFDVPENEDRPPVNTAIVIDKSGSMGGQKIVQARNAAIEAVRRLSDDDIVSVVLYADSATVLVPATKATDKESIIQRIQSVQAGGSTALFSGVSKGAAEVRKFLDEQSVNRVVLLSDGQANVGPKTPGELERLGESLVKEGITVSTLGLGLGYNEDLMSRLASAGSGNHMFVEQADDLVAVFQQEFNDLMSVVASDFQIHARMAEGVRPVRVLNSKADITGQDIYIPLGQLYARQQRYFVVEVEIDESATGSKRPLASVDVEYQNMVSNTTDRLASSIEVRFSDDVEKVKQDRANETFAYCELQLANERNIRATALRDAGKIEEARKLLSLNCLQLNELKVKLDGKVDVKLVEELGRNAVLNRVQSEVVAEPSEWNRSRKSMRFEQQKTASQQGSKVPPSSSKDK